MNVTKSRVSFGDPVDLSAGASFAKQTIAGLLGSGFDPSKFFGSVTLLIGNPGGNVANIAILGSPKDAPAVTGIPVAAGSSLTIQDLDPNSILIYKSSAGTTLTVQAGKANG